MRQKMMVIVVIVLDILITANLAYPGLILYHPETRTVPATEGFNETFVCTAQGDVSWYINDRWVSPSYEDDLEREGYTFTETTVTGAPHTTKNLTMTLPAKMSLNGTKIQCRAYGTDGVYVLSNIAWLWIAVPPQVPNVSLELTSWNTIQLSWLAPFTTEGYPIIKYIVYTTNTTTNQTSRTDIYPTGDRETHTISDTSSDCYTLQFEVLAENTVGKSAAGVIYGSFPIAVRGFSVKVSVMYNIHPQAAISFHLPDMCIGSEVLAKYILEVKNSTGFLILETIEDYRHRLIEVMLTLEESGSYTVNVTVYIPSYADLGSLTIIKEFSIQTIPSITDTTENISNTTPVTDVTKPEGTTHVPLVVGLVGGVFLVTLLIGIGLVAVCIRLWRQTTRTQQEAGTQSTSKGSFPLL